MSEQPIYVCKTCFTLWHDSNITDCEKLGEESRKYEPDSVRLIPKLSELPARPTVHGVVVDEINK